MEQITPVGIDLAKSVFSLHAIDGWRRARGIPAHGPSRRAGEAQRVLRWAMTSVELARRWRPVRSKDRSGCTMAPAWYRMCNIRRSVHMSPFTIIRPPVSGVIRPAAVVQTSISQGLKDDWV